MRNEELAQQVEEKLRAACIKVRALGHGLIAGSSSMGVDRCLLTAYLQADGIQPCNNYRRRAAALLGITLDDTSGLIAGWDHVPTRTQGDPPLDMSSIWVAMGVRLSQQFKPAHVGYPKG